MANLKNITELPVAESTDGLNLIVNDNGSAKQIAASAVGVQADWTETDETSPAFIKNKPVEEWDFDADIIGSWDANNEKFTTTYTINSSNFNSCKNKIINGIQPKVRVSFLDQMGNSVEAPFCHVIPNITIFAIPAGSMGEGSPEMIIFNMLSMMSKIDLGLLSDNSVIKLNLGGE